MSNKRTTWTDEQRRQEAFARDLAQLSSDTLEWLYSQIYDPADKGMDRAIRSVFWERHATPLTEWPTRTISSLEPPEWCARLGYDHLVNYCRNGDGYADPEHRAVRQMLLPRSAPAWCALIECSCGARANVPELKVEQRRGSVIVWPVVTKGRVPHFVVCIDAQHAEDPKHAPLNFTTDASFDHVRQCICRYPLNKKYTKLLPAQ